MPGVWGGGPGRRPALDVRAGSTGGRAVGRWVIAEGLVLPTPGVPGKDADVDAVGVDETAYLRATGRHPTW